MRTLTVLAALMAVLSTPALAAEPQSLPLHIGGRVVASEGAVVYQWPGTYFEGAFTGNTVTVHFADPSNTLVVKVDDVVIDRLTRPGDLAKTYTVSGNGAHLVRIERLTETQGSTGALKAVTVPAGKALTFGPRARQIEFIGDSYTVGYGNISPKQECTTDEVWATTDTQSAFGPLTARHYNADFQITAFSGRGIVRNYDGFQGDTLPQLYDYALFDGQTRYHSQTSWKPQIMVIGLGTNDFSTALHDTEKWADRKALRDDYVATHTAFVRRLRAENPQAHFILMVSDSSEREIADQVERVVANLKAEGEKVDLIVFTGLSYGGCHWHPSTADDLKLRDLLINHIDAHPEFWVGGPK